MLGGLPGHEHAAFKGRIYDEDRQLAFMEPAHFVTFNFVPGPHVFSATWWTTKHANSGAHVTLDLIADQHYFIETFVLNTNFLGSILNRSFQQSAIAPSVPATRRQSTWHRVPCVPASL